MKNTNHGGFAILGRSFKVGENPNVVTYSTLVNGLMDENLLLEAYKLACTVLALKDPFVLNTIMYSTIIKALCACSRYDNALCVLQVMEKRNLKPTVQTYGNIVSMLCKDGSIDQELNLMEVMINKKTPSDILI